MENESPEATVDVIYARPDVQRIVTLPFTSGMTAGEAVHRSGFLEEFPEITARPLALGIFGMPVEPGHVLAARDRVEICRPLERDPRALRRELSAQGKVMGGAGRRRRSSQR